MLKYQEKPDFLERLDADGNPKVFIAEPEKCKHCEILPMDKMEG